jgi:DNA polymerase
MHGCFLLEDEDHQVRLIVHDEVVCEVPKGRADIVMVATLMSTPPPWAADLPLKAKGDVVERYRKL